MVRGLGTITGVRQPISGDRLSKYGWTTHLTSGLDLGTYMVELDPDNLPGQRFLVRRVSGRFADEGDSGAAILDRDRKLVGLVIAGKDVVDQTYYTQALPQGEMPVNANLSVFTVSGL
jgi:hypothetical protein